MFAALDVYHPVYGELLARSRTGTMRVCNMFKDVEFLDELKSLICTFDWARGLDEPALAELEQAAFDVVCDPDTDGSPFLLGGNPLCTQCGSQECELVGASEGPDAVTVDVLVPHVTHDRWLNMTPAQKRDAVAQRLQELIEFGSPNTVHGSLERFRRKCR